MMNQRQWLDAHPSVRCKWTITLWDKSKAQCGRKRNIKYGHTYGHEPVLLDWRFCTQHQEMFDNLAHDEQVALSAAIGPTKLEFPGHTK